MSASGSLIGPTNSESFAITASGVSRGVGIAVGAPDGGVRVGTGPPVGAELGTGIGAGAPHAVDARQATRLRRKKRRLMQKNGKRVVGPDPGALMKGESPRH